MAKDETDRLQALRYADLQDAMIPAIGTSYKAALQSLIASKHVTVIQQREQTVTANDSVELQSKIQNEPRTLSEMMRARNQKQTPTLFSIGIRPTIGSNGIIPCNIMMGSIKETFVLMTALRDGETVAFHRRIRFSSQIALTFLTPHILPLAGESASEAKSL